VEEEPHECWEVVKEEHDSAQEAVVAGEVEWQLVLESEMAAVLLWAATVAE
jgi:hypothetical protein